MKKNKTKKRKITNLESHKSKKSRVIIKLPPGFRKIITDESMQKAFIEFARKKDMRPSYTELTTFSDGWTTALDGKKHNSDDLSINTYKLMRKDAQLQMGLKVIKLPIKAMKWWVVCQDPDIKAFVEYALKRVWIQTMTSILNALDFGWSACEKIWEVKDIEVLRKEGLDTVTAYKGKAVLLKKFKDPDPESVTLLVDGNGDFDGFEQEISGGNSAAVPPEKSFIFTNEKEFGDLYGKSLLRYSYDYWYWTTLMYQFLNRYFERRGTPPVIARAPAGRTNLSNGTVLDNLALAQSAGESLSESSVVALPSSIYEGSKDVSKWDLSYLKDDQRADMFMKYIEHLNAMKLRGLFVPERMVSQDSEMGAKAVADTHLDVFLMGLEGLTKDIIDHFNRYLVPQLIKYNFGDNAPFAYLETSGLSTESKNLLKQIVISVIKKGDGKVPLDMVKALEELDLPIGKPEDFHKDEEIVDPNKPTSDKEDNDKVGKEGDEDGKIKAEKIADDLRKNCRLSEVRRLLE